MITLREKLLGLGAALPAPLTENKKGHLALEFVVAERKSFLSRKKLVYRCALSLDDTARTVKFYEILKEMQEQPVLYPDGYNLKVVRKGILVFRVGVSMPYECNNVL